MREVGLPETIHSDGGGPFAGLGLGHLTRLGLHWLKLDIRLERSRPASPGDNASHERMHRRSSSRRRGRRPPTCASSSCASIASAPSSTTSDRTRHCSTAPRRSLPTFPQAVPGAHRGGRIPGHFELRRITHSGSLCWRSTRIFLSLVLARETVGLEEIEDGVRSIYVGHHLLARLDEHVGKIIEVPV